MLTTIAFIALQSSIVALYVVTVGLGLLVLASVAGYDCTAARLTARENAETVRIAALLAPPEVESFVCSAYAPIVLAFPPRPSARVAHWGRPLSNASAFEGMSVAS